MGIVGKYPLDFDDLVFSGISGSVEGVAIAQISFNLIPASLDPSGRFEVLDKGYVNQGSVAQDFQFSFYRYPEFDPKSKLCSFSIFDLITKQFFF